MAKIKGHGVMDTILLGNNECRKKQCIVVQHSSAQEQGRVNLPAIKNKIAVAHLYLQKPSFKRNPTNLESFPVQHQLDSRIDNNELRNSSPFTKDIKGGKSWLVINQLVFERFLGDNSHSLLFGTSAQPLVEQLLLLFWILVHLVFPWIPTFHWKVPLGTAMVAWLQF